MTLFDRESDFVAAVGWKCPIKVCSCLMCWTRLRGVREDEHVGKLKHEKEEVGFFVEIFEHEVNEVDYVVE